MDKTKEFLQDARDFAQRQAEYDSMLRTTALETAVKTVGGTGNDVRVLDVAVKFYNFLRGELKAE